MATAHTLYSGNFQEIPALTSDRKIVVSLTPPEHYNRPRARVVLGARREKFITIDVEEESFDATGASSWNPAGSFSSDRQYLASALAIAIFGKVV